MPTSKRKSASPTASRARCLVGLLRMAPGGRTFQATFLTEACLSTAMGPDRCRQTCDRLPAPAITGAPWRAAGAPGHMRLGPPGLRIASPMRHVIPRPPLPAPCLKMLYRHPSVPRRDARIIRAVRRAGISYFLSRDFNAFVEEAGISGDAQESASRALCEEPIRPGRVSLITRGSWDCRTRANCFDPRQAPWAA